jgi:hypothetical protein
MKTGIAKVHARMALQGPLPEAPRELVRVDRGRDGRDRVAADHVHDRCGVGRLEDRALVLALASALPRLLREVQRLLEVALAGRGDRPPREVRYLKQRHVF